MKRVLVAVDTSEISAFVVARAVELARAAGGKLRLFHAVEIVPAPAPPGIFAPLESEPLVASAEASLRALTTEVPEELRDGILVALGRPADAVCAEASAYDADLVVIGAHAYGFVERVLGTTAAAIVNRIDRAVLVVRRPAAAIAAAKPTSTPTACDTERPRAPRIGQRAHDDHVFLGATTLAGVATGVAAGAIAGPPGAVLGGAVGAAMGMLAGQVLDDDASRAATDDRELDDAVGVTRGDLGARELAAASLTALERSARDGSNVVVDAPMMRAGETLRRDHARFADAYAGLRAACQKGEWADVREQFRIFAEALRAHMDAEEQHVVPAFRDVRPNPAATIVAEHDELRRQLEAISLDVDRHAVPTAQIEELIQRVRAHEVREERLLYPWVDEPITNHASDRALRAT